MAWTAPRTYTANEVVTATILNTDLRDNLLALSHHVHTGAAGDGASFLGPLASVTFADQAADPAVAGRLQRRGGTLKWHDGTGVKDVAPHTHTLVEVPAQWSYFYGSQHIYSVADTLGPGASRTVGTPAVSLSKTSRLVGFGCANRNPEFLYELIIDGVVVVSTTSSDVFVVVRGSREVAAGSRSVSFRQTNNSTSTYYCFGTVAGVAVHI